MLNEAAANGVNAVLLCTVLWEFVRSDTLRENGGRNRGVNLKHPKSMLCAPIGLKSKERSEESDHVRVSLSLEVLTLLPTNTRITHSHSHVRPVLTWRGHLDSINDRRGLGERGRARSLAQRLQHNREVRLVL